MCNLPPGAQPGQRNSGDLETSVTSDWAASILSDPCSGHWRLMGQMLGGRCDPYIKLVVPFSDSVSLPLKCGSLSLLKLRAHVRGLGS